MVLLGQQTALVRHRGPRRRTLLTAGAAAAAICLTVAGYVIDTYSERPPWGTDIAYEAGFLQGHRIRRHDMDGARVRELLEGGCARMEAEGLGGQKATHNPAEWVAGCVDGAAGRPPRHQGLAY